MDSVDILQWPAMGLTIVATWLVGSTHARKRTTGFYFFLASNGLWSVWAMHASVPALLILQAVLAVFNVRGMRKTESAPP